MAKVVTVKQVHDWVRDGILEVSKIPTIFSNSEFPLEFYPQYIRLLHRFQIAYSLSSDRVLIPSKLPDQQPKDVTSDDLAFIHLYRIHRTRSLPHGFWSRFLARVLTYMKEMMEGIDLGDLDQIQQAEEVVEGDESNCTEGGDRAPPGLVQSVSSSLS